MDDVGVFIHWVPPSVSLLSLKAHSWFLSLSRYLSLSPTVSLSLGDHRGMGCSLSLGFTVYSCGRVCANVGVVGEPCVCCVRQCVCSMYIYT